MSADLRVLLVAPHISGTATGEGFAAFKIAEALQDRVRLSVMALQSPRHAPLAAQLPRAAVTTWPEPAWLHRVPRLRAMLKPEMQVLSARVRAALRAGPGRFDIAHQIKPAAMRYGTPLRGHGFPYVLGPFGGTLDTPPAFAAEAERVPWYTRLRDIDRLRLRRDPWLRAAISEAALVLGVAPYIAATLAAARLPVRRYADMVAIGIDALPPPPPPRPAGGPLRLLHVGRAVRTKGLRDTVRALALLRDLPGLHLDSAGAGEDLDACRREAQALGVAERVTFHGQLPRARVEALYAAADVFVFPSFREPAGQVLYEAMRWGLPVIGAARGGPDAILDDSCAIKLPVTDPQRFAAAIAAAIRRLADDPALRARLGAGGRTRLAGEGLWTAKADRLVADYARVVAEEREGRG